METKLDKLKAHAAAGEWREALRIAAKFPRLGDDKAAIKRAHEVYENGHFYRQLGRDPQALITAGIEALRTRYGLIGENDMTTLSTTSLDQLTSVITGKPVTKAANKGEAKLRFINTFMDRIGEALYAECRRDILDASSVEVARSMVVAAIRQADDNLLAAIEAMPAPVAADPAPAAAVEPQPKATAAKSKRNDALEAAKAGVIPAAPDMSAPTHKSWVKRLDAIKAMVDARDLDGLKADTTEPKSSSRSMICRYRDQAIIAIEAQVAAG